MAPQRVFTTPDGAVTILHPNPRHQRPDESARAFLDRIEALNRDPGHHRDKRGAPIPPLGATMTAVGDVDAPPPTRRFRACWRWRDGAVVVDLPLARAQRLAEIRRERDRRFAALDGEWTKATATGDGAGAARIDATRQRLRDVPQAATVALETCATPETVAAYEPAWP